MAICHPNRDKMDMVRKSMAKLKAPFSSGGPSRSTWGSRSLLLSICEGRVSNPRGSYTNN